MKRPAEPDEDQVAFAYPPYIQNGDGIWTERDRKLLERFLVEEDEDIS